MQIRISGRHQHLDESMRDQIRTKLEKMLQVTDRLESAEVTVDAANGGHRIEAVVHGPRGHRFVAHAEGDDLRSAVDLVEARLLSQIRNFKDRLVDHRP